MNEFRVTGKTVEDAVTEACVQLGVTSDKIEYEVIEKGSKGLLGFGAKLAVIEVRRKREKKEDKSSAEKETSAAENKSSAEKKPAADRKTSAAENKFSAENKISAEKKSAEKKNEQKPAVAERTPAESRVSAESKASADKAPAAEAEPAKETKPMDCEKVQAAVDTFLQSVFQAMHMEVGIEYQCDAVQRVISIELSGSDMGVLIGKRGQTLDSLQYLISLVANRESEDYVRVKLDTENYRRRRRSTLENLARNIAYKVKRERKPVTLEPMNPYERRIIHSALQNDRYVETHSEGVEPYRRVVISLKKNNNN